MENNQEKMSPEMGSWLLDLFFKRDSKVSLSEDDLSWMRRNGYVTESRGEYTVTPMALTAISTNNLQIRTKADKWRERKNNAISMFKLRE